MPVCFTLIMPFIYFLKITSYDFLRLNKYAFQISKMKKVCRAEYDIVFKRFDYQKQN